MVGPELSTVKAQSAVRVVPRSFFATIRTGTDPDGGGVKTDGSLKSIERWYSPGIPGVAKADISPRSTPLTFNVTLETPAFLSLSESGASDALNLKSNAGVIAWAEPCSGCLSSTTGP